MGGVAGGLLHFFGRRLLGYGHADNCTENQQSVKSSSGGVLGDGGGCEEVFCGDRTRKRGEEAELGIVELDSLIAKQRIG
jgi:hypothetical protein